MQNIYFSFTPLSKILVARLGSIYCCRWIFQAVVRCRRNKLKNGSGNVGLSFFRHEYRIIKIAHIGSRSRSEDQFLYAKVQFFLVPPHFQLVPPHYVCSGDGTVWGGYFGGLGAEPPAAGGHWWFGGEAPSRWRHWGRSPQRSKFRDFFAKTT